jgi:hypothetical protein
MIFHRGSPISCCEIQESERLAADEETLGGSTSLRRRKRGENRKCAYHRPVHGQWPYTWQICNLLTALVSGSHESIAVADIDRLGFGGKILCENLLSKWLVFCV